MERPIGRLSTLIASASAIGFLLAGCSAGVNDPVVGVPVSAPPATTPVAGTLESGIDQAVQAELAAANSIQSDGAPPGVLVEINALTGVNALIRAEAFSSLLVTGANEISKREGYVNALIADVQRDQYLPGITLSGRALSATLLSMLEGVNAQLQALAVTIQSDSLPDVLRSDVLSIGPSTRVAGLIEPMTHLAIAGGDELRELNYLASQYQQLQTSVAGVPSTDPNRSQEVARLSDLAASIASARQIVDSGIGAVLSLTASGFPSNKTTITSVRNAFIQMRSPLGKLGEAKADANAILALLAN
ncbi:MAG TPA: hypothetical protein VND54_13345 [Candidatus Saccharimonadales bacterium]|nr:hypothetical protein [Candidatus Saccharimonadales bacterium]